MEVGNRVECGPFPRCSTCIQAAFTRVSSLILHAIDSAIVFYFWLRVPYVSDYVLELGNSPSSVAPRVSLSLAVQETCFSKYHINILAVLTTSH